MFLSQHLLTWSIADFIKLFLWANLSSANTKHANYERINDRADGERIKPTEIHTFICSKQLSDRTCDYWSDVLEKEAEMLLPPSYSKLFLDAVSIFCNWMICVRFNLKPSVIFICWMLLQTERFLSVEFGSNSLVYLWSELCERTVKICSDLCCVLTAAGVFCAK